MGRPARAVMLVLAATSAVACAPDNGPRIAPEVTASPTLAIGGGEVGPTRFSRVVGIAVDDGGRIYVTDTHEREVRLFDSTGGFVRTIGRPGRGPGEYVEATGVALGRGNELFIYDPEQYRVTVFDSSGAYARTHRIPVTSYTYRWEGGLDSSGRVADLQWIPSGDSGNVRMARRFDLNTGVAITSRLPTCGIASAPLIEFRDGVIGVPFARDRLVWLDPDHGTWCLDTGRPAAYFVPFGDTLPRDSIVSSAVAERVTPRDRDSALAVMRRNLPRIGAPPNFDVGPLPDVKPVVRALARDDRGRLWLHLHDDRGDVFHVFSPSREWIARVRPTIRLPGFPAPMLVKGDRLYVIGIDSLDVPTIFRLGFALPDT